MQVAKGKSKCMKQIYGAKLHSVYTSIPEAKNVANEISKKHPRWTVVVRGNNALVEDHVRATEWGVYTDDNGY